MGSGFSAAFRPAARDRITGYLSRCAEDPAPVNVQTEAGPWVLLSATPSAEEGWFVVLVPIGRLKDDERALRSALENERRVVSDLQEIGRTKDALLSAVSHELRAPLAIVSGFALTLERDLDNLSEEDVKDAITRIRFQAQHLDRLLTDLLDTRRLAQGLVEPIARPVDVRFLVQDVVDTSDPHGRAITCDVEETRVAVDPGMVERIVENLLGNATKHTPRDARVWVRVRPQADGVLITVEDDGDGVPDDIKEDIFEPFVQGQEHGPGTGVGLSLVEEFARLHGGRAWVDDRPGGGAAFHVYLPGVEPSVTEEVDEPSIGSPADRGDEST